MGVRGQILESDLVFIWDFGAFPAPNSQILLVRFGNSTEIHLLFPDLPGLPPKSIC